MISFTLLGLVTFSGVGLGFVSVFFTDLLVGVISAGTAGDSSVIADFSITSSSGAGATGAGAGFDVETGTEADAVSILLEVVFLGSD